MARGGGRKPKKPGDLDAKDERAALGLAQGRTRAEAAEYAGMGTTALYSRLKDPAFKALVAELRSRLVSEAVGLLAAEASPAVKRLRRLLRSKDESIQLQAVRLVVQSLVRLGTFSDLNDRMTELEAKVADQKGPTA